MQLAGPLVLRSPRASARYRAGLLLPDDGIVPTEYHGIVAEARASIGRIRQLADDDS